MSYSQGQTVRLFFCLRQIPVNSMKISMKSHVPLKKSFFPLNAKVCQLKISSLLWDWLRLAAGGTSGAATTEVSKLSAVAWLKLPKTWWCHLGENCDFHGCFLWWDFMGFNVGTQPSDCSFFRENGSCHGDLMGLNGIVDELQPVGFVWKYGSLSSHGSWLVSPLKGLVGGIPFFSNRSIYICIYTLH